MKGLILKRFGRVRDFSTQLSKDGPFSSNPKARSILFENQGATIATLKSQGIDRTIQAGSAFVLGGYEDSMRFAEYQISFVGGAGSLIITQDIQEKMPVYIIDGVELVPDFCK